MPKKVYTWGKVKPGDIISFRYKGKQPTGKLATILVLNPRMPHIRKDKTKTFHLIGELEVVDSESGIYRVNIKNVGPRGVKQATYQKLKKHIERHSVYRTYDYREAKRSQVFLEPIVLPKEFREALIEN